MFRPVLLAVALLVFVSAAAVAAGGYLSVERDTNGLAKRVRERTGCEAARADILENLRWIHRNRAVERGVILRAADNFDAQTIRYWYAKAQVSPLMDSCTDVETWSLVNTAAERHMRITACGQPPHAASGSCEAFRENFRWSLVANAECSHFARIRALAALNEPLLDDHHRAARLRHAFKASQNHNSEVFDSADFLSNRLVISIATDVVKANGVAKIPNPRNASPDNPFASCAGEERLRSRKNTSPSNENADVEGQQGDFLLKTTPYPR